MDIIINKVSYYRSDESSFNMLYTFLKSNSSVYAYNVSSMYKISKNLWQITYMGGLVKYYKFGPLFNDSNDEAALVKKFGKDINIIKNDITAKNVISVIKEIFPIEDTVHFVRMSNQEILVHKLTSTQDYLKILGGYYPYFRVKLLVGEDAKSEGVTKVVSKILADEIRNLKLTIKSTEESLIAKKKLLLELEAKQNKSYESTI